MADVGLEATTQIMDNLKKRTKVEGTRDPERVKAILREELLELIDPAADRSLHLERIDGDPASILMVGVNGTGKTTTVASLHGCSWPRAAACCSGPQTPSAPRRRTSSRPGASASA